MTSVSVSAGPQAAPECQTSGCEKIGNSSDESRTS